MIYTTKMVGFFQRRAATGLGLFILTHLLSASSAAQAQIVVRPGPVPLPPVVIPGRPVPLPIPPIRVIRPPVRLPLPIRFGIPNFQDLGIKGIGDDAAFPAPPLTGPTLAWAAGLRGAKFNMTPVEVGASIMVAADLLNKTSADTPVDQLQVKLFLDDASADAQVTGRLLFWQPGAPVPGTAWQPFDVPSTSGSVLTGRVFVAQDNITLNHLVGRGPVRNPNLDLMPALRNAGIDGAQSTWILFEDPRAPREAKEHFRQIIELRPFADEFAYKMGSSVIYSAFADQTATQSVLPDNNQKVVFLFPSENGNVGQYPYENKTLSGQFTLPSGEEISYALDLVGIKSAASGGLPNTYSGHFIPTNLRLSGSLGGNKNVTVKAYRYHDGTGEVDMPVPLVRSTFSDNLNLLLPALEDSTPRDPTNPSFEFYVWAFVLDLDGVNVEFVTVVQGGLNAKRVKGFSFPF